MDPFQVEKIADLALVPGETLVWCGAPDPLRAAVRRWRTALTGLSFTGFAAFWIHTTWSMVSDVPDAGGAWPLFPLFGVPFLAIGLVMLSAPLWSFARARDRVYGVTSGRLFVAGRNGAGVRSIARAEIAGVEAVEIAGGSGDVSFSFRPATRPRFPKSQRLEFVGVRDAIHLEATIREQLENDALERARTENASRKPKAAAKRHGRRKSVA